ncbi:MAG: ergothioneine biosynthesis protein EgtB [Azospirillum sp.]|nr:ergothioneine biosynthesis protein EgtB [Azospirillum sp.]
MSESALSPETPAATGTDRGTDRLIASLLTIRSATEALVEGLSAEDLVVQSMPDASPAKWHLAHTAWFFETLVLAPSGTGYRLFHPRFGYLFNSYYEALGPRHARPQRGLLTRPSLDEVIAYRRHVTAAVVELLQRPGGLSQPGLRDLITLGLHHEQQHQELMLTDLLHLFSCNPLRPAYRPRRPGAAAGGAGLGWIECPGGLREIGHAGAGFAFDNETPRHAVFLQPFRLADRAVTNREWQDFIADRGYARPELWLADGWATVVAEGWQAPLYWERQGEDWRSMTLAGLQPVEHEAAVCHVSYFEADAFARWADARLPTEAEWESVAETVAPTGNTVGSGRLRPAPATGAPGTARQLYGDVWEWTASPYQAYPGFRVAPGAAGEYNGKFMCNQMVLRGGSCATPDGHVRPCYRNFFYPHQRWQFSGLRLARDW